MTLHSFYIRLYNSPIPRPAAVSLVVLVVLTWCGLAFGDKNRDIRDAAFRGNLAKVQALLKGNPDLISSKDDSGMTPLHVAAMKGRTAVARFLLANKADSQRAKDAGDDDGSRVVHEEDSAGNVPGRDGAGGALGETLCADQAALSEGRQRATTERTGEDAARAVNSMDLTKDLKISIKNSDDSEAGFLLRATTDGRS